MFAYACVSTTFASVSTVLPPPAMQWKWDKRKKSNLLFFNVVSVELFLGPLGRSRKQGNEKLTASKIYAKNAYEKLTHKRSHMQNGCIWD